MVPPATPLLHLMWLASPALPVGGFSYSEGLESAVAAGFVHDADSASAWLVDQMELTLVRGEWPLMHRAMQASLAGDEVDLQACNDWVLQTRETAEFRLQTEQMGRSLVDWLLQRDPEFAMGPVLKALRPAPTWPVAFAVAGSRITTDPQAVLLTHGFSWAENQVQAALKCIPLGQSDGQRVLGRLAQALPAAVEAALQRNPKDRQVFSPGLALLSAQHEDQYSRLFRS